MLKYLLVFALSIVLICCEDKEKKEEVQQPPEGGQQVVEGGNEAPQEDPMGLGGKDAEDLDQDPSQGGQENEEPQGGSDLQEDCVEVPEGVEGGSLAVVEENCLPPEAELPEGGQQMEEPQEEK